jgi:hypothetical protein
MLTAAKGEVIKTIWRRMGSCAVQLRRVSRLRRRRGAAPIPKDSQANLSPKSYISRLLKKREILASSFDRLSDCLGCQAICHGF